MSTEVCIEFDTFLYMDTFSARVAELVTAMGEPERGQQSRLAKIAGCTRAMVGKWLSGEAATMGYQYAKNIEAATGFRAEWIISGEAPKTVAEYHSGKRKDYSAAMQHYIGIERRKNPDSSIFNAGPDLNLRPGRFVAVVGTGKGGADGFLSIDDYPAGQGDGFIYTYSPDPGAYGVRVRGDSMRPRIKSGEYIIAEPNIQAQPGDDVVVKLKDGRAMVKELLWERDGEVSLGSINEAIQPVAVPLSEIESIHRVAAIVPKGSALLRPREE